MSLCFIGLLLTFSSTSTVARAQTWTIRSEHARLGVEETSFGPYLLIAGSRQLVRVPVNSDSALRWAELAHRWVSSPADSTHAGQSGPELSDARAHIGLWRRLLPDGRLNVSLQWSSHREGEAVILELTADEARAMATDVWASANDWLAKVSPRDSNGHSLPAMAASSDSDACPDLKLGSTKSMAGPRPRSRVTPRYPTVLIAQRIRGYVVAQFVVDTNGRPVTGSLLIKRASNEAFIAPVIEAVRTQNFWPATKGRTRCASVAEEPFVFDMSDEMALTSVHEAIATIPPSELLSRPVPTPPVRLHDGWDIDNVALNQRGVDLDVTARRTP